MMESKPEHMLWYLNMVQLHFTLSLRTHQYKLIFMFPTLLPSDDF